MPQFLATAPQGLFDVLGEELKKSDFKNIKSSTLGVFFECSWADCYDYHLRTRIASRILRPIMDFVAYQPDELYQHIRKHDFTKYIEPYQTLLIKTKVSDSKLKDQRLITMKIKDAVVDQFRDKTGERPSISDSPDFTLYVRAQKNQFFVAIDLTGESLFKRGYRYEKNAAPLKENLAAGLISLSEWRPEQILVDPMCGSGTFLIEAALMARGQGPVCSPRSFAFENLKFFDRNLWKSINDKKIKEPLKSPQPHFFGFDIDNISVSKARENAHRAGVGDLIHFETRALDQLDLQDEIQKRLGPGTGTTGMVITNPPYGERMGDDTEAEEAFEDLSQLLKTHCNGWTAWVLSGNATATQSLKMKSTRKVPVFNGPIECRFLKYEIFPKKDLTLPPQDQRH